MMVRLLLAVIVAGALIGASMPVIDRAQRTQADHELTRAVESIETATRTLVRHSDPVPMGVPPATRDVEVSLPAQSAGAELALRPLDEPNETGKTVLRTTVQGAPPKRTILNATVRPIESDGTVGWGETVTVQKSADLTLRYRLVGERPVITVARAFK